ncbi:MAG: TIGR02147 family protein [Chitinispirillaceae bacterium]
MVNIYNYINYRTFIQDYYLDKKKKSPSFSYQIFADIADFNDKSSIYSIIKGKRNISVNVVYKLSKAMNLKRAESEYFEVLVAFNQAKATHEKNHYFERLCKIRCRGKNSDALKLHTFRKDQFDFYSKWYNVMIRSIIEMHGFNGDYKWLASMTYPSITQKQARQSVKLLEKLELIRKNENGEYKALHKNVTTGKELMPLAISNFHQECIKLASKALDEMPSEIRNFSGLTLGISDETYKTILSELREFQNRVTELASHDKKADRVYHFNFHLFPTSKNDKPNKKQL